MQLKWTKHSAGDYSVDDEAGYAVWEIYHGASCWDLIRVLCHISQLVGTFPTLRMCKEVAQFITDREVTDG